MYVCIVYQLPLLLPHSVARFPTSPSICIYAITSLSRCTARVVSPSPAHSRHLYTTLFYRDVLRDGQLSYQNIYVGDVHVYVWVKYRRPKLLHQHVNINICTYICAIECTFICSQTFTFVYVGIQLMHHIPSCICVYKFSLLVFGRLDHIENFIFHHIFFLFLYIYIYIFFY